MIKRNFLILISLLLSGHYAIDTEEVTPMLQIFDDMQIMMTGEEFNRNFYEELIECMDYIDPTLKTSQNGAWQGIIDYWNMNGASDDLWGSKNSKYVEYNITTTVLSGMTIYEPCGYSSNIAYYYPLTEMCARLRKGSPFSMPVNLMKSIGKGFAQLAMGSAFRHGSHTKLGTQQDNDLLRVLAYQFYQASIYNLDPSPILHDLAHDYRELTAYEMIEELDYMYTNMNVVEWREYTDNLHIPTTNLVYSGIVVSMLTLLLPPFVVDLIIDIISNLFSVPETILEFVKGCYLPEIRSAISTVKLNIFQRFHLGRNILGTAIKIIYAFLWQERIVIKHAIIFTPEANLIGRLLLPFVNKFTSIFMSFRYFNKKFQIGKNIYPGDCHCNLKNPHSKWHLQSAISLLDFVYVSDDINKILS